MDGMKIPVDRPEFPLLMDRCGPKNLTYLLGVDIKRYNEGKREEDEVGVMRWVQDDSPEVLTSLLEIRDREVTFTLASKHGDSHSVVFDREEALMAARILLDDEEKRQQRSDKQNAKDARRREFKSRVSPLIEPAREKFSVAQGGLIPYIEISFTPNETKEGGDLYALSFRWYSYEGGREDKQRARYWNNLSEDRAYEILTQMADGCLPGVEPSEEVIDQNLYLALDV